MTALIQSASIARIDQERMIGAQLTDPSNAKEPERTNGALPAWGWLVTATTPDGRILEQQFLVALEDGEQAMARARSQAAPSFILALGARIEGEHLARRKMQPGDVFELGHQRIGRGKNAPR